jgi:hypothetical protein
VTGDAIEVSSIIAKSTLYAVKNPWGLANPCEPEGGQVRPVDQGVDPFVAYLRTLPGVTVDTTKTKIGGYRAVNVALTSRADVACPAGVITAWTAKDVTSGWRWQLDQGDTASFFVVEHPQATFIFEYSGDNVTAADARAVVSSIAFADSLPPAP